MKKIVILAVLLLCLTGCGSNNNKLVQNYKDLDESYVGSSEIESELAEKGYGGGWIGVPSLCGLQDSPYLYSNSWTETSSEEEPELGSYGKQLLDSYKGQEFPFVEYEYNLNKNSHFWTNYFEISEENRSRNAVLAFCKKLKEKGFENLYESVQKNDKGEVTVIQDGVEAKVNLTQNSASVSLENHIKRGPFNKQWTIYTDNNVTGGFWFIQGTTGGLMDRLTLEGGKNEIGCTYAKQIQVYQKDKKVVQVILYFQKNQVFEGVTFLPKEKQSTINILKTIGVSEQEAKKFVDTYDPEKCKDITLDGKTYTAETKDGKFVLAIR